MERLEILSSLSRLKVEINRDQEGADSEFHDEVINELFTRSELILGEEWYEEDEHCQYLLKATISEQVDYLTLQLIQSK